MAVTTYQATVRFLREGKTETRVKFFSGRGPKTNQKATADAEAWIGACLEEMGAWSCDATISQVLFHIKG